MASGISFTQWSVGVKGAHHFLHNLLDHPAFIMINLHSAFSVAECILVQFFFFFLPNCENKLPVYCQGERADDHLHGIRRDNGIFFFFNL